MSAESMREIVIEAALNDPYDGAMRLLADAQRFGFELRAFVLAVKLGRSTSTVMTLGVPASSDAQLIAGRLARHLCIQRVTVKADVNSVPLDRSLAVAA